MYINVNVNKKKKTEPKRTLQVFSYYFYYFLHMTIFQFLQVVLLFLERCLTTTRGVYPQSFLDQLISFHLRALDRFLQQDTKKGQHDCNEKEITPL